MALAAFDEPQATRLLEDLFPAGATGLVSAGLAEPAFEATVGAGRDSGYVVALDRRPFAPCQQVRALLARAAWLDRSGKTLDAAVSV